MGDLEPQTNRTWIQRKIGKFSMRDSLGNAIIRKALNRNTMCSERRKCYPYRNTYLCHRLCLVESFFALSIFHFNEEKVPAILTTCMFLLVSIAVLSLYCAKEIQTNTSHIVSLFVFVLPFSLLVCVQLLDFREISASGMRLEWVAFLVFLAFVTLPVRYWVCCAMVLVLFLGQLSAVVFKLFKNKSSPMDILYQVSDFATSTVNTSVKQK